ncbi:MAG: hypothetical protein WBB18_06485 [Nodosilinea sp.]
MEYWEFLLQKEGDQSWLPLDASQVEILEGRYRVMAHTSYTNTPVRIQIKELHEGLKEEQRGAQTARTMRRQSVVNNNGLMVVMPFTRMTGEGTWDIQCAADEAVSDEAQSWCYGVQLRVLAQNSTDDDDWFADDPSAGLSAIAALPQQTESVAAAPQADLDLQAAAAAMDIFQNQTSDAATATRRYELTLLHTALLGSEGEGLSLSVTIDCATAAGQDGAYSPLMLVVRLSDPQTAATVALTAVELATAALPNTATLTVTVPTELSTRLLLGEVGLLVGAAVTDLQRFTVTVDVASLFDAIANQAETDTDLDVVFSAVPEDSEASSSPSLDLKAWNRTGRTAVPREMPILTLPRSSVALPPKIYYPSPHEVATHQPTLPPTGRAKPSSPGTSSEPSGPGRVLESSSDAARIEANRGLSLPPISPPPLSETAALSGQPDQSQAERPQLLSHEAMGFKDLKLQDRFWTRLNELAANLQREAADNRTQAVTEAEATAVDNSDRTESSPKFVPFAGEVVVYEDEDPVLAAVSARSAAEPGFDPETAPETVTPPAPTLVLPDGELVAGEPVLITLRVPFHPNRLYLKIWVTDPQTRSLADEPRQIMNLMPNGQGQLEGVLQLTVPLGCLEAWFEAISIDMVTQQESYKASVCRPITLPGLTSSGLDEFQI